MTPGEKGAPPPWRESPRLVEEADGRVWIVKGEFRHRLPPMGGARALAVWQHMGTHGEAEATTYLMGVVDGLMAETEANALRILDRTKLELKR